LRGQSQSQDKWKRGVVASQSNKIKMEEILVESHGSQPQTNGEDLCAAHCSNEKIDGGIDAVHELTNETGSKSRRTTTT
jgi:hypothetical protein